MPGKVGERRGAASLAGRCIVLATALALFGSAGQAEEKPAGGVYPPPTKPAAALDLLKAMSGSWVCNGVLPAGAMPSKPEIKYRSTIKVTPVVGGLAYTIAYAQNFAGEKAPALTAFSLVGWDPLAKRLTSLLYDSLGTISQETAEAREDGTLALTGPGVVIVPEAEGDTPSPRSAPQRDTFMRKGETLTWQGEVKFAGPSSDWLVIGKDECKRN